MDKVYAETYGVTRTQMNGWAGGFENWADCDTVCFKLFDRTPFAWEKALQWSSSRRELVKRGGFVLMACLALHDKTAKDESFLELLPVIERGAQDERNFVKKGVSWALRGIGRRVWGSSRKHLQNDELVEYALGTAAGVHLYLASRERFSRNTAH
jgi:3-methyladenine DNA glycosylase AlkD